MNYLLLNLIIALLFTAIATLLIGLFVLFKSKNNKTNLIFSFYSFSISLWSFCEAIVISSTKKSLVLLAADIEMIFKFFIPTLFLHFAFSFLNIKNRSWLIKIAYVISGIISFFSIFSKFVVTDVVPKFYFAYWPKPGFIFHLAFIFFAVCVFIGLYELFKEYGKASGAKKNQLAYLIWPTLLGYIGGGANFFYYYNFYVPVLNPFGTYFVGFYILAVAFAILKYQLMDINVVVKKALVYSLGIAFASGSIIGVSFLSSLLINNIPGFRFWVVPLVAGTIAFLIGRIFWNKSKEVEKLKYEFITVAAHKLRTPLTEIKWAASELKTDPKDKNQRKLLVDGIEGAANRLIDLTGELLEVTKVEASQYKYKMEPVNFKKIVDEVLDIASPQIEEKKIKIKTYFEKKLPLISADKIRISSVIQSLLENAVTYTKDKIEISVNKHKRNIVCSIKDNGIGIAKEDQDNIFSKFYRTKEAFLSETEGTGIGLFLAKSILEKHAGKIGVKSEGKDKGSIFWFSLPV